jgi:hypothetical protein
VGSKVQEECVLRIIAPRVANRFVKVVPLEEFTQIVSRWCHGHQNILICSRFCQSTPFECSENTADSSFFEQTLEIRYSPPLHLVSNSMHVLPALSVSLAARFSIF